MLEALKCFAILGMFLTVVYMVATLTPVGFAFVLIYLAMAGKSI